MRCVYCHNPDTWIMTDGQQTEDDELVRKIKNLYPYIKGGGVTFSGGEPLMQAPFFTSLAKKIKSECNGLHIALDTSGCIINDDVTELVKICDLIMLDVKFTTEEDYVGYTGGSLKKTLDFLHMCQDMGKKIWVRHVVVPELNDTKEDIDRLKSILKPYAIERIEYLPFRKLCLEKYDNLGIKFPLRDTPEMDEDRLKGLCREI